MSVGLTLTGLPGIKRMETKTEVVNTIEKPNKHQLRTRETRGRLLKAAEKIFVRDGYEAAELGAIAALANRTKGAIYAHFKSKEDIFLALVEDRSSRHREEMRHLLAATTRVEENRRVLRQFYLKLAEDESWTLLLLEFKLFAIRHPNAKKRYQGLMNSMISAKQEKQYSQLLGAAGTGKGTLARVLAVQMLQPMLSALAVEAQLVPDLEKNETRKTVFRRIFEALLPGQR